MRKRCPDVQARVFHKDPVNRSHRGLKEPLWNCRTLLKHNILEQVSFILFFENRKCKEAQKFSISQENQTFLSPKLLTAFCAIGYPSILFYIVKKSLKVNELFYLLTMETLWKKLAKSWILLWCVLNIKLGFPQNNCLPSNSQSTIAFFCRMTHFPYLRLSSFFGNFDTPKLLKDMYMYVASLYWNHFFPVLPDTFHHQDKLVFENFRVSKLWLLPL